MDKNPSAQKVLDWSLARLMISEKTVQTNRVNSSDLPLKKLQKPRGHLPRSKCLQLTTTGQSLAKILSRIKGVQINQENKLADALQEYDSVTSGDQYITAGGHGTHPSATRESGGSPNLIPPVPTARIKQNPTDF